MTSSAILVTAPDDTQLEGARILLVDLDTDQSMLVSDVLTDLVYTGRVVLYVWKTGDDIDWLFDKKHKSQAVIFNANSTNDLVIGYMAAQRNASYFGVLRSLTPINNSEILSEEQCKTIFENCIQNS